MDFISAAWASQWWLLGAPFEAAVDGQQRQPHHEPSKKPRQGSGAREIREIRSIRAMKPLQTLKGSTQSAHHLRRLAGLDPLPQIAAEAEGGTDA